MESISSEWLEVLLGKHEDERRVAKVVEVKEEPVVAKGENYMSQMIRVRMKVVLGSGRITSRCLLVKRLPAEKGAAEMIHEFQFFKKEIKMYRDVMPFMELLQEELGDGSEPLWGQCLEFKPYTELIFEDLKEKGYRMGDRLSGLSFKEALMVVKSLGRFHGTSAVLADRGTVNLQEFKSMFTEAQDKVQMYQDSAVNTLADVIRTTLGPQGEDYSNKLRSLLGKTIKPFSEMLSCSENQFRVLNHGDCWVNNILFKYDQTGEPIGVKFVDFQLSFYGNYVYDLQYLFTTSVPVKVLEERLDELLEAYQSSLELSIIQLGGEKGKAPSKEEVKSSYRKSYLAGLIVGVMGLNFMLREPTETLYEFEDMQKEVDGERVIEVPHDAYRGKLFTEKIKFVLTNCDLYGVFS